MTVKAGVNEQAIREAVAAIEASEEHHDPKTPHWNQLDWAQVPFDAPTREEAMCGTALCLAGWAVYLDEGPEFWKRLRKVIGEGWEIDMGDRYANDISARATRLFGISEDEANEIFSGGIHTLDELKATITEHLGIEW